MSSSPSAIRSKFLALDAEVQGHIHAGLRSAPTTKTYNRWYWRKLTELQDARDAAREEWRETAGPELSYKEKMIASARGHSDLESTQAARRICLRKGIDWS